MARSVLRWQKQGYGYLPPLPNSGSPHTTATTKLIDLHYSNLRIAERWTWDRYQRLCSFLKLTEYELASLCLMPHDWVGKMRERNRLPCVGQGGGRAVAMLLTMTEATVMKNYVPDVIVNPMPNMNRIQKQGDRLEA